jgi:hypothetical protein
MINPEQFDNEPQSTPYGVPSDANAAMILELIQVRLDEANITETFKRELLTFMRPYLNIAAMTNISRGQVMEFILGYNKLWTKYRIFVHRDKFDADVSYLKDWILEIFVLQLNRSIEGWQGDRVFEKRSVYDVKQKSETRSDRIRGFFGGKKEREENER